MRLTLALRFVAIFCVAMFLTNGAHACQCGAGAHGKNAWENARQFSENATVIFEGTPIKFELRWSLLNAKAGELIPASIFLDKYTDREPYMTVTFRVERAYKGALGQEVQLRTGLGGGDCGAVYMPGLKYLAYTGGPSPDQLWVSMCSPGGWIDGADVATDLRYLRKDRPTAEDLQPIRGWSEEGWAQQEERRKRRYEESHKNYEAATGRICGSLGLKSDAHGTLAFLSTLGYSPLDPPYGEIKEDNSFCSPLLGPGKYYPYFVQFDDHGTSALYYPGVKDIAEATPLEVLAGRAQSNVVFHVRAQSSYSVRGLIFANQKPDFGNVAPHGVVVVLIRSDGDRRVWFSNEAEFFLPKTAYFKIDHVVPGHYIAWAQAPVDGWMTRKVEIDVTNHMKLISLDLVRKN
jgi:hypothetical protein